MRSALESALVSAGTDDDGDGDCAGARKSRPAGLVPVVQRVPSLPATAVAGNRVELAVGPTDLLDLTVELEFRSVLDGV